jgi:beta-lactamase class D OXA-29
MNMQVLVLIIGLFFSVQSLAEHKCFLAKEKNNVIKQEGSACNTRFSPESTFKIALSLMGYDSGVLEDEHHPTYYPKKTDDFYINICKEAHNPKTWMRDSCVWYSHALTENIGMESFKNYVINFNYGNKDVIGDNNNGLTNSWLSSSLQISSTEQIKFLQKIIENKLPVSAKSLAMTKKIMFIQDLPGGWRLFGKTGSGKKQNTNYSKTELQHGWFVGWIEKNNRVIVFANHITDDKKQDIFASIRAKNEVLIKLWYLINELEK